MLEVQCVGYAFPANWRTVSTLDGAATTASAWVTQILTDDCGGFLGTGVIDTNSLSINRNGTDTTAWDQIAEIAALGDASGNYWRAWVDNQRRLHYRQLANTPAYYWRNGVTTNPVGRRVSAYHALPGVFRDVSSIGGLSEVGGFLASARDFLVEEVEADADGVLTLKTGTSDEADILAAQADYQRYVRAGGKERDGAPHYKRENAFDWEQNRYRELTGNVFRWQS